MEDKDLKYKIIENVRNNIVISNLESEEKMRISNRKKIVTLGVVALMTIFGSFATVNAATDGKLIENIKEFVSVKIVKDDGSSKELNGTEYKDKNGDTWIKYENNENGTKTKIDVNKTELEKQKLTTDTKISENELNMTINSEK